MLVVDDSAVVRAVVRGCLEERGYLVHEAEDGHQGLARLADASYDVVITDVRMPGADGFELLAAVKRCSACTEVVVLTGTYAQDPDSVIRALRLGAHDYLAKPPNSSEEIVATVERALGKKRLRETNERLLRELEAVSRTDALTGLLNRRCFEDVFRQECRRAERYGSALTLIMFDIDRFKSINDRFGHRIGDEVLRHFADVARRVLREADALYRYGGEEFAALLAHTDLAGARRAAQRLLTALRKAPALLEGRELRVTCSAGVAAFRPGDGEGEALLGRADRALYSAKRSGRDRVGVSRRASTRRAGSRSKRAKP